jgi:hypothetical protein
MAVVLVEHSRKQEEIRFLMTVVTRRLVTFQISYFSVKEVLTLPHTQ